MQREGSNTNPHTESSVNSSTRPEKVDDPPKKKQKDEAEDTKHEPSSIDMFCFTCDYQFSSIKVCRFKLLHWYRGHYIKLHFHVCEF